VPSDPGRRLRQAGPIARRPNLRPHFLRTDGAARGNPGPAGIGLVLETPDGRVLERRARGIGWATNNVAEYTALIEGLELAESKGIKDLVVLSDSTLLVEQMRGSFKVKSPRLRLLHAQARELTSKFRSVGFQFVPRAENAEADRLANEGIDDWIAKNPGAIPPQPPQGELF
jgi:ribonuclease HI